MFSFIIKRIILSILIILCIHYLYNYFLTSLENPLEKSIISETRENYEKMFDVIKKENPSSNLSSVSNFSQQSIPETPKNTSPITSMKEELLEFINTLD